MSPEASEFESRLAALPLGSLDPKREAALLRALLTPRPTRSPWYIRRIPIWAAACIAMAVSGVSWSAGRARLSGAAEPSSSKTQAPLIVRVDAPLRLSPAAEPLQLALWSSAHSSTPKSRGEFE